MNGPSLDMHKAVDVGGGGVQNQSKDWMWDRTEYLKV